MQQFSHVGQLRQHRDLAADESPLVGFARERLGERGLDDWTVRIDDVWCRLEPANHTWSRIQGWKLHVSGAASSAQAILRTVFDTLVDAGCPFKFACSIGVVRELNSSQYPRGGAGKFITVYPDGDEQAVALAKTLHEATEGMVGQVILSDRPYVPGSLVSYRYGGFVGKPRRGNDSDVRYDLVTPDGGYVEDRRDPWFNPPPWARCPFPEPEPDQEGPASVLLDGRYLAREALRHANKGGVFLATDTGTGVDVVIKQARRHVGVNEDGWEARDGLRNEARMLERFGPAGVATRLVGLFEQQGDLFLATEYVDGESLRTVAEAGSAAWTATASWARTAEVAGQLVDLLDTVHGAGIVLRDLSPNNVLVRPDGRLVLIDLEYAAPVGERPFPIGTPGYHAPEQLDKSTVADLSADLYSLGALLYLLATGADPVFAMDEPAGRSIQQRISEYLGAVGEYNEAARTVAPLVLGLVDAEPGHRWKLDRVRRFLASPADGDQGGAGPVLAVGGVPAPERLIIDGLDWLAETITPDAADRLWPAVCFGLQVDPCNVQHGAAGIAATLLQAHKLGYRDDLAVPLTQACTWIADRVRHDSEPLPGLYFGGAGAAWLLHDAGSWLADDELTRHGWELARRLPLVWPNADVTHGSAGAGLTQLHLWQATGDDRCGDRLRTCVDAIAGQARRADGHLLWPTAADFDSEFAGKAFYGFAHGSAGIGWLLLAAGIAADRPDWRDLAAEAGDTLCRVADRRDGIARWRSGPDENQATPMEVWCNGSSGVGTFLIRLWRATGQDRFRELAEEAARAVWTLRAGGSPANCHGLAGNGDFLLDMFDATGDVRYRSWAEDLAAAIGSQYVRRGGRYLVPNESRVEVTPEYGVGVAGTLAFLLRLEHGTERMWMAEPLPDTVAYAG